MWRARLEEGGGYKAVLTDAGLERLEEAGRTHVASARRHIFDRLEPGEVVAIVDALERHDVQGLERLIRPRAMSGTRDLSKPASM